MYETIDDLKKLLHEYESWQDELFEIYEDEKHDEQTRRVARRKIQELEEEIFHVVEKAKILQAVIDEITDEKAKILQEIHQPQANQAQQKRGRKL